MVIQALEVTRRNIDGGFVVLEDGGIIFLYTPNSMFLFVLEIDVLDYKNMKHMMSAMELALLIIHSMFSRFMYLS